MPDLVTELYRTFLRRDPEPAGLAGWADVIRQARLGTHLLPARLFLMVEDLLERLADHGTLCGKDLLQLTKLAPAVRSISGTAATLRPYLRSTTAEPRSQPNPRHTRSIPDCRQ